MSGFPMQFFPYTQTASVPNIIVDGPRNAATVLALSHWSGSGTPLELRADTSTEIVFKYLDAPQFKVQVDAVSNNHFDEDGLPGIFALLDPVRPLTGDGYSTTWRAFFYGCVSGAVRPRLYQLRMY
jgi:hypothetical protein